MPHTTERISPIELMEAPSEELQEIVGQAPKAITRWGTAALALVLVIILCVSFLVKYAEVVSGTFTLSAYDAPKSVISKTDGKIQVLFSKEQDVVQQGKVLAWLECNAAHDEVIRLSEELQKIWENIRSDNWQALLHHQPASYKKLGELQSAYQTFISEYIQLHAFLSNGVYAQKKLLLAQELKNLTRLKQSLQEQEKVHQQDYEIASQDFQVKRQLYEQKIIPLIEYKQEESKYLSKKLPIENTRSSIINNDNAIANKQQELIQLDQQFADEKSKFLQALNTLISNIDEWKRKYLLMAPVAGKVSWRAPIQAKQDVAIGQELFYITPSTTGYYGELVMAQENFGKLRLGQQVLISLSSFPFQEFGKLKGRVSFISGIPDKNKQYYVSVKLENGLLTDMGNDINYSNGLIGTAEVITRKTRLINKFLFTIRQILNKPKAVKSTTENAVTLK